MTLRFKRSRQLDAEIETVAGKWGFRAVEPDNFDQMGVDGENGRATVRKTAIPACRNQPQPKKQTQVVCNMKNCYCRVAGAPKQSQTQNEKNLVENRSKATWDQILSRHVINASPQPKMRNKSCQVGDENRPERPTSLGHEQEVLANWCHPQCFVEQLAHQAPGQLVGLKSEVDKAVSRMGLGDCLPPGSRSRRHDVNRDRVVLEYLEDLSVEMLKKRLDESEAKYKSLKSKLEEALVAQKLEIQSLQRELFLKNEEITRLSKNQQKVEAMPSELMQRERDFLQRIRSLDDRMKAMMERDERTTSEVEKYKQAVSDLKGEISRAEQERDLFKAKMEIYQQERDKAVASLSVYEKTFKNLRNELGHEIQGIKPSLDLTADSCGTLDCLEPRGLATSSPNVSFSQGGSRSHTRKQPSKKRTKHTLVDSDVESLTPEDENVGKALIKKLEGLGKEFKQFSEKLVIPMAMGLDVEAAQLLDVSASTGLSWTDVDSPTIHSSISRHSS